MKKLLRLMAMVAMLCCSVSVFAQEKESETQELARVPQALKDVKLINKAKPNLKAKVYFVYQSRSTCGFCVMEAPELVKEYKKMKRRGCEMVMINVDGDPKAAEKWVKNEKMEFPVIHPSVGMSSGIPWEYSGKPVLPCMVAMTADGTKLGEAGGSDVAEFAKEWKKMLRDLKKEEAKKKGSEKKAEKKKGKKKNNDEEGAEEEASL